MELVGDLVRRSPCRGHDPNGSADRRGKHRVDDRSVSTGAEIETARDHEDAPRALPARYRNRDLGLVGAEHTDRWSGVD